MASHTGVAIASIVGCALLVRSTSDLATGDETCSFATVSSLRYVCLGAWRAGVGRYSFTYVKVTLWRLKYQVDTWYVCLFCFGQTRKGHIMVLDGKMKCFQVGVERHRRVMPQKTALRAMDSHEG